MAAPASPRLRPATEDDVPLILTFIREFAEYERLRHEARGRGVGRRLLVHLAGIAQERGCGRL